MKTIEQMNMTAFYGNGKEIWKATLWTYTVFYAIGWAVFYGRLGHQIGSMRTNWLSSFAFILYGVLHPLTFGAAFSYFIAFLLEGFRVAMIVDGHTESYFIVHPDNPIIQKNTTIAIGAVMSAVQVLTSIIANTSL